MANEYPLEWVEAKWQCLEEVIFNRFKDEMILHGADPKDVSKLSLEQPEKEHKILKYKKDVMKYTGAKYIRKGKNKNG